MTVDFAARWAEMERERQARAKKGKELALHALAAHGVKYVVVDYNGYGDSGNIETIAAYGPQRETRPEQTDDEDCRIDLPKIEVDGGEGSKVALETLIDGVAWSVAYNAHPGFENNEGGQGQVIFDVVQNKIIINHEENVTEVVSSTHEL